MNRASFLFIILALPITAWSEACPVTKPGDWPNFNVPMKFNGGHAWYGSELLAAAIPKDGIWRGMGRSNNFGNKFWWWRSGFSATEEPTPDLSVSAIRLDGPHETVTISTATSGRGFGEDWDAMLVGMHFPSKGCWEVRGTYNGNEELTLVLKVSDDDA